jgi:transcriptional regulator with GAF, ATPase, and Fis domain
MIDTHRQHEPSSSDEPDQVGRWRAWIVVIPTVAVLVYSIAVLWTVMTAGDIGIRCVFGLKIKEVDAYRWSERDLGPPREGSAFSPGRGPRGSKDGDELAGIDGQPVTNYTEYIRGLKRLQDRNGEFVRVDWQEKVADGPTPQYRNRYGFVRVQPAPWMSYLGSFLWFAQEAVIFAVGAVVFWRRPNDDTARVFFGLCVVTVVAFMGGYHWGQIARYPALIFLFAAVVVYVPVVSLHFYLIFPRHNPIYARHRPLMLGAIYGLPTVAAAGLWSAMIWSRWGGPGGGEVETALELLKWLALGYIAVSVVVFLLCLACLSYSYARMDLTRAERNQVRWVRLATILAVPPICWLLWDAFIDPARLGLPRSAWPMTIVSLLYTAAYAFSITRYKLMQAEALYNRGRFYVLVSMLVGLAYSGLLVLGTLIIGEQLKEKQASLITVVSCVLMLGLLAFSGVFRRTVQAALDRRFHREKYMFDQAMRKMSQAVGSLVDRATLGRRLLDAAGEVLRVEWGAIYLGNTEGGPLALAACCGPEPDERRIDADNPLIDRLGRDPTPLRASHPVGLAPAADPAADAMIALGGEVAAPLEADGALVGLLVLGPKRSGLPFEDEEVAFLAALGSVAVLALRSADIQQTLESLNHELREKVEKIAEQQRRILILQDQLAGRGPGDATSPGASAEPTRDAPPPEPGAFGAIRGSGPAVRRMIALARKVAASPSAVLIRGESGTGKELLAEAIHNASARVGKPFVKVHCAALSQGLLESELFGHVKGAFTDARSDRVGRFQQADGGTLFLDEIGDINLEVQTKLLRVLQEMQFERVGSSLTISVDVRILAATHQDLEALIRAGRFREDLFYRLNVISLRTPSLRERREDIFELAIHFLNDHARRVGKPVSQIDDAAMEALVSHDWPGNVRELENVVERAVVLADGPAITLDDLPPELRQAVRAPRRRGRSGAVPPPRALVPLPGAADSSPAGTSCEPDEDFDAEADAFERERLLDALHESDGNKSEAARLLAMPRSTFFSKLKKHGLVSDRRDPRDDLVPGRSGA